MQPSVAQMHPTSGLPVWPGSTLELFWARPALSPADKPLKIPAECTRAPSIACPVSPHRVCSAACHLPRYSTSLSAGASAATISSLH
ncbi:hypothetical protein K461DRAFT_45749 [Myriangium duriaei CBS 260.36]|uniref:Uncharacterized protein n=1 Tax=Myriangium duriaei CBS 260.36 TaxID=1168546 RepID=A0A9P4MJ38_9PEZI|nr:hypothetical protein K461DRAFT_45749 [Myriangium duriaei CBS 260.36]